MTVHVLDVGQGSATLLELPCAAILVDAGGELNDLFDARIALERALSDFFAGRPDLERTLHLLVITHPHIDHMRGLPVVLEKFRVLHVVDNGQEGDEVVEEEMALLRRFLEEKRRAGAVRYRAVAEGEIPSSGLTGPVIDPIRCGEVDPEIRVLWGRVDGDPGWGESRDGHRHAENANNHSVVLRVDFGESSVLITGDLEDVALDDLVGRYQGTDVLDVDLYIVGHHGSHNGTTRALLEAMTPEIAVISMGREERKRSWTAWQYGHPRRDAVFLLVDGVRGKRPRTDVRVAFGTKRFFTLPLDRAVYATGWDGTVVIDATAEGELYVREP